MMEQWYRSNVTGPLRNAVKDSLLENTMWYGAPIRFDRPRSAIVHCTETLHKDAISTVLTAEIMKYEENGQLKAFMTCSVLVPNLFLSGELEGSTVTVSHAYFHEVEQRILRVDFEHGGVFARPTLTKPGSAIDLFAGFGGWAIGQDWATEATGRSNPHITVSIESNRSTAKHSAGLFGGVFWEKSDLGISSHELVRGHVFLAGLHARGGSQSGGVAIPLMQNDTSDLGGEIEHCAFQ